MEGMTINWYPGHMAKARRQMAEQLKRVDLVLEVCDARLPFSSRNPELNAMIGPKKRILILNKSDLADDRVNRQWLNAFREMGLEPLLINSLRMNRKELLSRIGQSTRDITERALARGLRKTVRAMVVGVPNVGKSTIINQLRGGAIARTGDRPGVTRGSQTIRVAPYLDLLDTPGLLWPRLDDQNAARRLCYIGSVRDEAVDLYHLTAALLEDLKTAAPQALMDRYHVSELSGDGSVLMEAVCRGRGWLVKGGEPDLDRCCRVVLDEFRGGKIGRISLESPSESIRARALPDRRKETEGDDRSEGTGGTAALL